MEDAVTRSSLFPGIWENTVTSSTVLSLSMPFLQQATTVNVDRSTLIDVQGNFINIFHGTNANAGQESLQHIRLSLNFMSNRNRKTI